MNSLHSTALNSTHRAHSSQIALLLVVILLNLAACAGNQSAPTATLPNPPPSAAALAATPTNSPQPPTPTFVPTHTPEPSATATATNVSATAAPSPTPLPQPRIFIASEQKNVVQVFEGDPPRLLKEIPVGHYPHNISVSNDSRYVGVGNRHSNEISVIDTKTLTEVVRIAVGRQPHDLSWAPDKPLLYVSQEQDSFITIIDTTTWKVQSRLVLDSPQHDLAISPDLKELWATTVRYRGILIINRETMTVTQRLAYFPHGSHDAYFTPDGREVWVTSSGFISHVSQADNNMVIFDAATRAIKTIVPLGEYPFHSIKRFRDGPFTPTSAKEWWFSDRTFGGIFLVNIETRQSVGTVKTGRSPFHLSFGPNGWLYVSNHDDATFSIVDPAARKVLATIPTAPDPHGIVVIAAP